MGISVGILSPELLDSNKALSRSITGVLLRGQGDDARVGESLRKVDDVDNKQHIIVHRLGIFRYYCTCTLKLFGIFFVNTPWMP